VVRLSPRWTQRLAMGAIWGAGAFSLFLLLFILGYVVIKGIGGISWTFLTTEPTGFIDEAGGISSCIVTTLLLIVLSLAFLVGPGIATGIYLAEYARQGRLTTAIRYGVDTLAGVPSIIFGLFGFIVFVTLLGSGLGFSFSILAGAMTLACLLLPVLVRTSEEAIKAVPRGVREASLALGATRWQTVRHVVLPAAIPGIMTGITLCIGRAMGETACLYLTVGGHTRMPETITDGGQPLALNIYYLMTATNEWQAAMATAVVLFASLFAVNASFGWLSRKWEARIKGRA